MEYNLKLVSIFFLHSQIPLTDERPPYLDYRSLRNKFWLALMLISELEQVLQNLVMDTQSTINVEFETEDNGERTLTISTTSTLTELVEEQPGEEEEENSSNDNGDGNDNDNEDPEPDPNPPPEEPEPEPPIEQPSDPPFFG
jgi:hypothetical protein